MSIFKQKVKMKIISICGSPRSGNTLGKITIKIQRLVL